MSSSHGPRSSSRSQALRVLTAEVRGWQADQEGFDAAVAHLAGLNRTDWRCLDILGTRGPLMAGQLADALRLTTGSLTVAVDRLERVGLVRRIRDEADRRRVRIELTDEVARRAALAFGPYVADVASTLDAFDDAEIATITQFVHSQRVALQVHTARVHARPAVEEA